MFNDISKVVLFSDMDGTLLNSKKQISDCDGAAIERFISHGGKFTVATGRTIQAFEQYTRLIDLKIPVIMYNGAAIHDYLAGKTVFTHPLPDCAKDAAVEILDMMPDIGGEVLKTDGTYVFSNTEYQQLHTKLCNILPFYRELREIADGGWLKVLFALAPEDIPFLEVLIKQKGFDRQFDFVRSAEIFLEMLPKGVSKGSALKEYRNLPGMENMTFVAVGDFDNDIEMIREADLGVCPANAEESVRAESDMVLSRTNDQGAIAELIDYIVNKCGASR